MAADTADTATSLVDNSTLTVGTGAGAYTALGVTSQSFGCLLPMFNSSTAAASPTGVIKFSTDGADTGKFATRFFSTSATQPTGIPVALPLIYIPISSGVTISAAADAPSAFGSIRAGYYGFY